MTTITTRMLVAISLLFLAYVNCRADDAGYWSLELPVPESGSNAVDDTNLDFLTKKVSFDWRGQDVSEIREFYSQTTLRNPTRCLPSTMRSWKRFEPSIKRGAASMFRNND